MTISASLLKTFATLSVHDLMAYLATYLDGTDFKIQNVSRSLIDSALTMPSLFNYALNILTHLGLIIYINCNLETPS